MSARYARLPKGFRTGHCGDVACPHRDLSVCPECGSSDFLVEVYGQHFFAPDGREAAILMLTGDTEPTEAVR